MEHQNHLWKHNQHRKHCKHCKHNIKHNQLCKHNRKHDQHRRHHCNGGSVDSWSAWNHECSGRPH